MTDKAIKLIAAQQEKEPERSAARMAGEQLKEMCRREPAWAEIIAQDLEHGGLTIREAERRIKAFADKHKIGNFSCVLPNEAEKILREYFGLPDPDELPAPETPERDDAVRLEDFF